MYLLVSPHFVMVGKPWPSPNEAWLSIAVVVGLVTYVFEKGLQENASGICACVYNFVAIAGWLSLPSMRCSK